MTCYTGSLVSVPRTNRSAYLAHARAAWPLVQSHGALQSIECWGVDIPRGEINDFYSALAAPEGEAIVLSWIAWPDAAAIDRGMAAIENDPRMMDLPEMPFDGARMIYGTFQPLVSFGALGDARYLQGFVLPVPAQNKAAYADVARQGWDSLYHPLGARQLVEGWGIDVPHGTQTDFYRATLARADEVPLFSWIAWADKAQCDAATRAMTEGTIAGPSAEMPFDAKRMIFGGFEIIFNSHSDTAQAPAG